MLIQVSETRWLSEPETVWRRREKDGVCAAIVTWVDPKTSEQFPDVTCEDVPEDEVHRSDHPQFHRFVRAWEWVARMPTGELEWLSDEEYEVFMTEMERIQPSPRVRARVPVPVAPPTRSGFLDGLGKDVGKGRYAAAPAPETQQGDES